MKCTTSLSFCSPQRGASLAVLFMVLALLTAAPVIAGPVCGPGLHFIDTCPGGTYTNINSVFSFGIQLDLDLNGSLETSIPLFQSVGTTDVYVGPGAPHGAASEIYRIHATGPGGAILRAGDNVADGLNSGPLHSPGTLAEQAGDPALVDSFFDVFFEIELPGGLTLHNQTPLLISGTIDRLPFQPGTTFQAPNLPIPLFTGTDPTPHGLLIQPPPGVDPKLVITPEPSTFGFLSLGLGSVVLLRRRRQP